MAGPTSEVLIDRVDGATLDAIDQALTSVAEEIERTRKGRAWNLFIRGHPIHVQVRNAPPAVELSAGCNEVEENENLRGLSEAIIRAVGGIASEPEK